MPTLDFKGKQFVYSHHLGVPFRELVAAPEKSLPADGAKPSLDDNLIVHGDNLEALKALLPTHAGKVDCVFIDPRYNTGNDDTEYKRRLFELLSEHTRTAKIVGELGIDGGMRFEMLLDPGCREALGKAL